MSAHLYLQVLLHFTYKCYIINLTLKLFKKCTNAFYLLSSLINFIDFKSMLCILYSTLYFILVFPRGWDKGCKRLRKVVQRFISTFLLHVCSRYDPKEQEVQQGHYHITLNMVSEMFVSECSCFSV